MFQRNQRRYHVKMLGELLMVIDVYPLEELQRGCEWPVSGYLLKSEVENTGMP
jgi:hypothetical protein